MRVSKTPRNRVCATAAAEERKSLNNENARMGGGGEKRKKISWHLDAKRKGAIALSSRRVKYCLPKSRRRNGAKKKMIILLLFSHRLKI